MNNNIIIDKTYSLEKIFSKEIGLPKNSTGYCIYRIHNLKTNKSYIGDCRSRLDKRFLSKGWSHRDRFKSNYNHPLYNSMRKYGVKNFTLTFLSVDEADKEKTFIEKYNSYKEGYNLNSTGLGNSGDSLLHRIAVNNREKIKFIKSEEKDLFLKKGWALGYGDLNKRDPEHIRNLIKNKKGIFSEEGRLAHIERTKKDIKNKSGIYSKESVKKRIENSTRTQRDKGIGIFEKGKTSEWAKKLQKEKKGMFSKISIDKRYNIQKEKGFWSSEMQSSRSTKGFIRLAFSIDKYLSRIYTNNYTEDDYNNYIKSEDYQESRKLKYKTFLKYLNYENKK